MARLLKIGMPIAVALAALSLLLPYEPVYDPWGWLVWGRELVRLDLATASGMSWKPLPVLIDGPLSLLGDAAPKAWLLVARSGWILAPLLAGGLAVKLTGASAGRWRFAAAALAAGSVALTADSFTPPTRQFTGGLSEPMLVALALGAFAAGIEGRVSLALWLGVAASLLRPECWPFLAIWAVHAVRLEPRLRGQAIAAAAVVPIAWFIPDLLGAGDPLAGPRTARGGPIEPLDALAVLGRAASAPLAAAWIGVGLFLAQRDGRRSSDRALTVLLLGAAAWIAVVAAMAVVGFAGLPRFLAPASAAIAIVGGAGVARAGAGAFTAAEPRQLLGTVTAVALLAIPVGLGLRFAEVPGDLREVEQRSELVRGLFDFSEQLPSERLLPCGGPLRLAHPDVPPTALAWKLDRPLATVRRVRRPRYGIALSTRPLGGGRLLWEAGRWRATRLPCAGQRPRAASRGQEAPSSARGRAIAGVSGAAR